MDSHKIHVPNHQPVVNIPYLAWMVQAIGYGLMRGLPHKPSVKARPRGPRTWIQGTIVLNQLISTADLGLLFFV